MRAQPTVLFLGDGMADEPLPELGGRTPLQAAGTPAMDRIAREGRCGTLLTLPQGFPSSSDVANMSVLGCDLATEYGGRGPLEAAGQDIPLGPEDLCFRVNLVSVDADGILRDYSGGRPSQAEATAIVELLNRELATDQVCFRPGVSYRNLLVLSGTAFGDVATDKPDDNHGQPVAKHLPRVADPAGEHTAAVLRELMTRARPLLAGREANAIWPWSGGRAGAIHNLDGRYGIRAAVISAVDVINGLGRCLGMDVLRVPGATGYVDTHYEGKADAAIAGLRDHDFVFVHVEAMDEVSHARDLKQKLQCIEDFDRRLVARVMAGVNADEATFVVLPDHPVPLRLGKHTRTPVPVAVRRPGWRPDTVRTYDEQACPGGALGAMKGRDLMDLLFAQGGLCTSS